MTKMLGLRLLTGSAMIAIAVPALAQAAPPPSTSTNTEQANKPATQEPAQPAAPASESAPPPAAPAEGLHDIIITAQRTASSAQKTPIAINVYTGKDLASAGVTNVVNLQAVDPSINVTTSTGAAYVAVRGIASTDVTETGDPAVSIARDDFFTNRSFSIATSMYDLERVEVLKGPQGTLFGRNSTGGLIQLITRKPGNTFEADGSLEVGDYNEFNADLGLDLPVSDALQFRFAGIRHYHEGYRKLDVVGGRGDDDDTWSGRATMAFQPFHGLKGWVQYQHDDIDDVGDVAMILPLGVRPDGLSAKHFANYAPTHNRLKGDRVRWEVSYEELPGHLTLFYAGGWDKQKWRHQLDATSVDPTGAPAGQVSVFRQAENPTTWNHEVRLATSQDGPFTAQVGYFHFYENNSPLDSGLVQLSGPFTGDYLIHFLYGVKTKSDAVFGQFGFRPIDTVRITAGARYTWDSKLRTGASNLRCDVAGIPPFLWPIIGCNGTPPTLTVATPAGGEKYKEHHPTFHLGVDWSATPRNLLYAKFDTGYKAGGFNSNGSAQPVPYGPETVQAWEVGSKNRFFDNHLQLNVDGFYQLYNGYQASQSTTIINGAAQGIFNVGKARITGAEAQFVASLGNFRADANATLLDTKITHVNEPGITRGSGVTVPPSEIEGNHLPNAPGFVVTGGIEYAIDAGSVTFTPRLDGKYSTSYYYSVFNDQDTKQRSFATLNASLNIVPHNLPFEALLFVRNLTDKKVFANAMEQFVSTPFPINEYEFQPPRTYGVRLSFKWQGERHEAAPPPPPSPPPPSPAPATQTCPDGSVILATATCPAPPPPPPPPAPAPERGQ
jgi:iron complex outermembrane receptor protein